METVFQKILTRSLWHSRNTEGGNGKQKPHPCNKRHHGCQPLMSGKSEIKVVTKPELKSRTEEFCW